MYMYLTNPGNVVSPISEANIAQRRFQRQFLVGPSRVVCIVCRLQMGPVVKFTKSEPENHHL